MCWRRMNPPDLIYWVFFCHARQLWGCCALLCVRAGSGGRQGEAWGRAFATGTPESSRDTHGTRCLHGLVAFLDPSEKQNIWDHRASFTTLEIKPPGVTVRQGLQSWSITQKAVTDFFNMENDVFPIPTDDIFCSNGTRLVTPTCYFNFLCTITPYL